MKYYLNNKCGIFNLLAPGVHYIWEYSPSIYLTLTWLSQQRCQTWPGTDLDSRPPSAPMLICLCVVHGHQWPTYFSFKRIDHKVSHVLCIPMLALVKNIYVIDIPPSLCACANSVCLSMNCVNVEEYVFRLWLGSSENSQHFSISIRGIIFYRSVFSMPF